METFQQGQKSMRKIQKKKNQRTKHSMLNQKNTIKRLNRRKEEIYQINEFKR